MVPNKQLSTNPVPGTLLFPDNKDWSPLVDWEYGGVALGDASQGLTLHAWSAAVTPSGISIGSDTVAPVEWLTIGGVTEVALAFDQNMNPAVAYVTSDGAFLRYYNTSISGYTTMQLEDGAVTPRLTLDDKRQLTLASSDIILLYLVGDTLFFRAQRDRFAVAYNLGIVDGSGLRRVGMSDQNRLQIEVV